MPSLRLPRALSARLTTITPPPPHRHLPTRSFSSTTTKNAAAFKSGPAPPRLPKSEQAIFEDLQRQSAISGAFSQPKQPAQPPTPESPQSPDAARAETSATTGHQATTATEAGPAGAVAGAEEAQLQARVEADGQGEELHPNVRRGAKPEFEGEVNPKTGEVGGPKNEPLRWGGGGDWSYNGRVTDF